MRMDENGTDSIEFSEFFGELQRKDSSGKSIMIFDSYASSFHILVIWIEFKNGAKKSQNTSIPFGVYISQERRAKLMAAVLKKDPTGIKRMEVIMTGKKVIGV